jgi:hypothetical protein
MAKKELSRKQWCTKQVQRIDRFGRDPRFVVDGQSHVRSLPGSFMSIVMVCIVILYAAGKARVLINKLNPNINITQLQNTFTPNDSIDLNAAGFKIAFGVADFNLRTVLDDPKFVSWEVKLITGLNQIQIKTVSIPFHKCTP